MKKPKGRPRFKITESQRKLIQTLGNKGMPDVRIAEQMKLPRSCVTHIVTNFWKQKMIDKDEGKL